LELELNDGRAPDTTKKLVKELFWEPPKVKPSKPLIPFQFMKPDLHAAGLRLLRDHSIQCYPWNGSSSCWVDSSLEALFFCFLQMGMPRFTKSVQRFSDASPKLRILSEHMQARLRIYETAETVPTMQNQLADLRDQLASDLNLDTMEDNNPMVYLMRC